MTITELINKINAYVDKNDIYDLDCINDDLYNELKDLGFKYVTSVASDEHRWYILSENVYSVIIDGRTYYLGTWEVSSLKSEYMSVLDCDCKPYFYEMERYTTVSYREKR